MKVLGKYLYLLIAVICIGIGALVYYNNIRFNDGNISLGDASGVIDTGYSGNIILAGNVDVPSFASKTLNLSPNVTYVVSFDYVTAGGTNKFNVDLFPDNLPEKIITATTTKQHYEWKVSSSSNDMKKCQLRFFDNQRDANEKDITISNVKMEVAKNATVSSGIDTGLPGTVTLSGAEKVPTTTSDNLNLVPNATYIVSFDYVTTNGTNKFNIDLFPDNLPEIALTATTTKQHYDWAVSSGKAEMSNCQLRFFDNYQEANEGDIKITNIKIVRLDNQTAGADINTGLTGNVVLEGSKTIPEVRSSVLNLTPNTSYVVTFDYRTTGGTNKFNVDLFPDSLPETRLTATTTNQHYTWKVSSSNNDIKSCQLRFFDDQQEANEKDIIITNVKMSKVVESTGVVDTGFPGYMILLGNEGIPVYMSKHLNLSTSKTYTVSFDYETTGGTNKFNIDLFPDSLPEISLTATTKKQHYDWKVSSKNGSMADCQLRFFDNIQEANEQNIIITKIKVVETFIKSIKLDKTSLSIVKGNTATLKATIDSVGAVDKKITWSSNNTKVATVDASGKVKGIAAGTANITAKASDGKTVVCKVTITNPVVVEKITVTPSATIGKGGSTKLTATITPTTATNKTVTWTSSNTKVATVDANGNVKGVNKGEATITVKSNNGKTATSKITVTDAIAVKAISLDRLTATINVGASVTLKATITPSNATNKSVKYSSSNPNIATVDASGKIVGKAAGEAVITAASANGKVATCKVTVNKPVIQGTAQGKMGGDGYDDAMGYQIFYLKDFTNVSVASSEWKSIINDNNIIWNTSDINLGPVKTSNGSTMFIGYSSVLNKKILLTGTKSSRKVVELTVTMVPGVYRVTFDETSSAIDVEFGKAIGKLPSPSKTGFNFDGWYTYRNGGGTKITENSTFTANTIVYPKWTAIISETYQASNGYYEMKEFAFTSDTLKYRAFKKSDASKYYAVIWVKDPYNQINSASNNFNGGTRQAMLNEEIGAMGYGNKGMIAVNGGFTINGRSNIPVLIDKGNQNNSIRVFNNENYASSYGYGTLTVGRDGFIAAKGLFTPVEARIWLANQGGRNTWAITHYKDSNWKNDPNAYDSPGFRTILCQVDRNNFVLYVGNETTKSVIETFVNLHNMFGCQATVNLDGGGSSGLYYKNRSMSSIDNIYQYVKPNERTKPRKVADMLYFVE